MAFGLKVTPTEKISVVLSDIFIERHGGLLVSQTREGQRLLVQQRLQPDAFLSAVVQHQEEIGSVRQHAAGAERALSLRCVVGRCQRDCVLEKAEQGEQWQQGVCVADLDSHRFTDLLM